jgi:hypothetical protein
MSVFGSTPSQSNVQSAEIVVVQDINTPQTVPVTVFNVSAVISSGQTSIPIVADEPIEGVSSISVDTNSIAGASYVIASVIPVSNTANIETSAPVLFSLYFKALDSSGNSVVTRNTPFVVTVTLSNTENIKLIKYVNGSYVTLDENTDYGVVKSGNEFTISFYSNSFVSVVKNNGSLPYFLILKNRIFIGEKQRLIHSSDYLNYKFYSSNNKIATIDYMGYVTPLSKGYFYVIVTNKNGDIIYTSTFLIKVEEKPEEDDGNRHLDNGNANRQL